MRSEAKHRLTIPDRGLLIPGLFADAVVDRQTIGDVVHACAKPVNAQRGPAYAVANLRHAAAN